MRIGIDARFITHPQRGGFKTYTENLIAALAQVDTENEYVLYIDRPPQSSNRLPHRPNFSIRIVPGQLPMVGLLWREQIALARQVAQDRLDVFHSPCLTAPLNLSCRLIVTIHDMIWLSPEKFSRANSWSVQRKLMEWYYRLIPEYAARRASSIIAVSQATKLDIVEQLKVDAERIFVTHEAASERFRQIDGEALVNRACDKYFLPSQFILAIGSADPRKNITTLIQAYASLPAELQAAHPLAIVWTHSFLADELTKHIELLGLMDRVHFLEQVPDEDLVLLYNGAALFIFPSLYEGFGLPLLEAMACGTPIIACSNSSIPEITGDAALLVDAQDAFAMTNLMIQVLTDKVLQSDLIRKGLARVACFSWNNCARQTLAVYRQCASS